MEGVSLEKGYNLTVTRATEPKSKFWPYPSHTLSGRNGFGVTNGRKVSGCNS
jgi:hypothetical protein